FQAEDGIRDRNVTGVQTCALPICSTVPTPHRLSRWCAGHGSEDCPGTNIGTALRRYPDTPSSHGATGLLPGRGVQPKPELIVFEIGSASGRESDLRRA